MKKKLKILMVDDHPMILEAYKNILTSSSIEMYDLIIDSVNDCDTAIVKIQESAENSHYDMLFLDIKLPPSRDGEIISGEDLAIFAKGLLPKTKIVILTMFNESHRIHNILTSVNPEGLLIKVDLTSEELLNAFDKIINDPPYYSSTVAQYFRKQTANSTESLLDDINRKIIFHISKGVKTKNLTKHVSLSLSAIEKRKVQIKNLLELENANDEELILEAKKRGFV